MHKLYARNRIITMQKIFPSKKKAFSLVELSMVIIVIGLLISGVTAGGSLVKNSRISSARSITLSSQIVTIPGMVLWLENSAKDSFSASQINGGAQITNWYNREPSNYLVKNNLTTTASNNVLYQDTSTNNIPAVNMNVTGNMTLANFAGSTLATSTVVIVFKPTSQTSGTAMVIADSGASANTTCSIGIKNNARQKSMITFGIIRESLFRFGVMIKVTVIAPMISRCTSRLLSLTFMVQLYFNSVGCINLTSECV